MPIALCRLVTLSGCTMATQAERRSSATLKRRARWNPSQQSEAYLFLLPSFAGFLLFVVGPVLGSLALSFVRWNLLNPPTFIGLNNYVELLTRDTIYFTVTIVPLQLAAGLAAALALNQAIRGVRLYRLIYFMPVVSSVVAAA